MDRKEAMSKFSRLMQISATDPDLALRRIGALFLPYPGRPRTSGKVNGSINFEFDSSLGRDSTAMMYFGAYEVFTLRVLRRMLKPGDSFVDVGANIGYLSACAASYVGRSGEVHCFEPVPEMYQRLTRVVELNPDFKIFANQLALGEQKGEATIAVSSSGNIGQNTMVDGYFQQGTAPGRIRVLVERLDEYLSTHAVRKVSIIKIDTEGFELPVLKGLDRFLTQSAEQEHPVLIVEVSPDAYPLLGRNVKELQEFLREHGYSVEALKEPGRAINLEELHEVTDILCLPAGSTRHRAVA